MSITNPRHHVLANIARAFCKLQRAWESRPSKTVIEIDAPEGVDIPEAYGDRSVSDTNAATVTNRCRTSAVARAAALTTATGAAPRLVIVYTRRTRSPAAASAGPGATAATTTRAWATASTRAWATTAPASAWAGTTPTAALTLCPVCNHAERLRNRR